MKINAHIGLVILISASPIFANEAYVGAKTGWVHGTNSCESHRLVCDNDALGGAVFAGYELNDWLALEAGYNYFGKIKADYPALANSHVTAAYTGRVQGVELALKPQYYLSEYSSLFAKVGTLAWWTDVTGNEVDYQHTANDKGWSPMLGVGMESEISDDFSARLEYQWFHNVGGNDTGGSSISMLTAGIAYRFGSKQQVPVQASPSSVIAKNSTIIVKKMHIELNDRTNKILFEYNSSKLTPLMIESLQPVLERLIKYPQSILTIEAHTDSRGSFAYNKLLSEQRALSINNYFVSQGIAPSRLTFDAKGEMQPVADNNTVEGRSLNRRVVLFSPSLKIPYPN
jgi:OOP family OmpA-OmpF porin